MRMCAKMSFLYRMMEAIYNICRGIFKSLFGQINLTWQFYVDLSLPIFKNSFVASWSLETPRLCKLFFKQKQKSIFCLEKLQGFKKYLFSFLFFFL